MPFSALLVPVPDADWLVRARPQDGHSLAAGLRVPAHVTLLVPFAPQEELTAGVLAELDALFADVVPFSFALDQVRQLPDGPVYLAPDPDEPFRLLIAELFRRFPEYPPYAGQVEVVIPHVTVPLRDGETLEDVERLLAPRRPLRGHAREAQLVWVADEVEPVARFEFGTAAA